MRWRDTESFLKMAGMTARRRGTALEEAIRRAVLGLLADGGHAAVTMDAVAARAHTSKPVLYRRWPDRTALVRDVVLHVVTDAIPTADTGAYRTDMLAILRGWAGAMTGTAGTALAAVVAAMPHDAALAEAFRDGVIGWRKQQMATLLRRGIDRGEVRDDVPIDIARELGQSILWHRFLVSGDPITDDLVVQIVDDILIPFVRPRPWTA